jgi:hypothetical protein
MASNTGNESTNASSSTSQEPEKKLPVEPIRLPTPEEIRGQDIWNNCAVRSVVSGVMGTNQKPFFRFNFLISAHGFDSFFFSLLLDLLGCRESVRKITFLGQFVWYP